MSQIQTKNKDHSKIDRTLTLIRLLKSKRQGVSVSDMAEKTGVHQRTIYRYLNSFNITGFDLIRSTDDKGIVLFSIRKVKGESKDVLDLFPELSSGIKKNVKVDGENVILLERIFFLIDNNSGRFYCFSDVNAIVNQFPEINRWAFYRKCASVNEFDYGKFTVYISPLMRSKQFLKRYKL